MKKAVKVYRKKVVALQLKRGKFARKRPTKCSCYGNVNFDEQGLGLRADSPRPPLV